MRVHFVSASRWLKRVAIWSAFVDGFGGGCMGKGMKGISGW